MNYFFFLFLNKIPRFDIITKCNYLLYFLIKIISSKKHRFSFNYFNEPIQKWRAFKFLAKLLKHNFSLLFLYNSKAELFEIYLK